MDGRRVRMTKKMIKESLVELAEIKSVASISVRELCDRADVDRSTFYRYYNSPQEVLLEICDEWLETVCEIIRKGKAIGSDNHLVMLLEFTENQKEVYLLLVRESDSIKFMDKMFASSGVTEYLTARIKKYKTSQRQYLQQYILWGAFKIIELWLKEGCKESYEEMEQTILLFINRSIG